MLARCSGSLCSRNWLSAARLALSKSSLPWFPAPLAALNAIAKGCNLPLEEGLKAETDAFVPLVGSPISRNLIAVFFMTQRLQKDTGVSDAAVKQRDVGQVLTCHR